MQVGAFALEVELALLCPHPVCGHRRGALVGKPPSPGGRRDSAEPLVAAISVAAAVAVAVSPVPVAVSIVA